MIRRILYRQMEAFEKQYNYDASYSRLFIEAGLSAFMGLWGITKLANYHRDIPLAPWYAAKIVAAANADCGPCTQLTVKMAEQAGVRGKVLEAIVSGTLEDMPADVQLGYRFAAATLAKSDDLESLRAEVVRRWGNNALVSLAGAIASAAVFPTIKAALGYHQSCPLAIEVGGQPVRIAKPAQLAHT